MSPNQSLITAAVLIALAMPAVAQLQFGELPRSSSQAGAYDFTRSVALGDVDGDGDLDLVTGNTYEQARLQLNDGTGAFLDVTLSRMPVDILFTECVELGDVDGDGDLDMVLGNYGQSMLYLNNGAGMFSDATAARMPPADYPTGSVALGDVDGDGDLDIVLGNKRSWPSYAEMQNRLYLNNGSGTFSDATASRMPVALDETWGVALGDVDGDGDLDLVFGNYYQDRLCLNNGTGTFSDVTASRMPVDASETEWVELGDVDGDGDLDMVLGNNDGLNSAANVLYLNNGTGTFSDATASRMPVGPFVCWDGALGDVDSDGDLDLVIGTGFVGGQNRLLVNNGTGTFSDATASRMPVNNGTTSSVALGDVDGDGDLDLVTGKGFAGRYQGDLERVYTNLQRQLHAPVDMRLGQGYTLDAYLRYPPAGASSFALPVASFAPASTALPPYGTLGIAQPLITLPLITIPPSTGVGSFNLAIPNYPWLLGLPIYSQALLVPYPFQALLSNVVSDVIGV